MYVLCMEKRLEGCIPHCFSGWSVCEEEAAHGLSFAPLAASLVFCIKLLLNFEVRNENADPAFVICIFLTGPFAPSASPRPQLGPPASHLDCRRASCYSSTQKPLGLSPRAVVALVLPVTCCSRPHRLIFTPLSASVSLSAHTLQGPCNTSPDSLAYSDPLSPVFTCLKSAHL